MCAWKQTFGRRLEVTVGHKSRLLGVVIDHRHVRSGVGLLYVVIDCGVCITGVSTSGT